MDLVDGDRRISEVATDLGTNEQTTNAWHRQDRVDRYRYERNSQLNMYYHQIRNQVHLDPKRESVLINVEVGFAPGSGAGKETGSSVGRRVW